MIRHVTEIVFDPETGRALFFINGKPEKNLQLDAGEVLEFGFNESCACNVCIGVITAALAHFQGIQKLPIKIIIGEKAVPRIRRAK